MSLIREAAVTCDTCEWEGDAEQERQGHTDLWVCPECGTQHEVEVDFGPDPDDWRDAYMDSLLDD